MPRQLIGNAANGTSVGSVTGFAFSERGALIPVGTVPVPDPASLTLKVDASGAFAYKLGDGPLLDGWIEISKNDLKFKRPRIATATNVTTSNLWEASYLSSEFSRGTQTLYVRATPCRIECSPAASVTFRIVR